MDITGPQVRPSRTCSLCYGSGVRHYSGNPGVTCSRCLGTGFDATGIPNPFIIQDLVSNNHFKDVLSEWAIHLEMDAGPTIFANLYLEWIGNPSGDRLRGPCRDFLSVMKNRTWEEILLVMAPQLNTRVLVQFEKPYAKDFYETWKAMVLEQVRYFEEGGYCE